MGNIKTGPWPGHRNLDEVQACETPVRATNICPWPIYTILLDEVQAYEINSSWGQ